MNIAGSCHCGNIAFRLGWPPEPKEIRARACTCSFCRKHGGVWTSNPEGLLDVAIKDESLVSRYTFGTRTAVFHICSRCGAVPLVTSEIEGTTYAVVNVNAFDDLAPGPIQRESATFDGEMEVERLARRVRNWIPHVRFVGGLT